MAVTNPNMPRGLEKLSPREKDWLWDWLLRSDPNYAPGQNAAPPYNSQMINQWVNQTGNPEAFVEEILAAKAEALLPKKHFDWIDQRDERLLIWLLLRLTPHFSSFRQPSPTVAWPFQQLEPVIAPSFSATPTSQIYDKVVFAFDTWLASLGEKKHFLATLYTEWRNTKAKEPETNWLDRGNHEQISWAWNYLCDHGAAAQIPTPADQEGFYVGVLASIDHLSYQGAAEKQLFLDRMRRTWSQKKYRDSQEGKKQRSFFMTKETSEKLDALAGKQGVKAIELLERLVKESYNESKVPPSLPGD